MEPVEHEPVDVRELGQNASRYVAAAEAGLPPGAPPLSEVLQQMRDEERY